MTTAAMTPTALPLTHGANAQGRAEQMDADRDRERVQIRAARLRITTDRKLGKKTPEWVRELAARPL